MSLTTVSNGANINPIDINQVINVLQRPSGGQETGHYFCGGNSYINGGTISVYVYSQSRNSTPISVSIDTTDVSPSSISSPITNHLTSGGFQVYGTSSGITTHGNVAGAYTIQF